MSGGADMLRGLERRRVLEALLPLRERGLSYQECAAALGHAPATLWRLEQSWQSGGEEGLDTRRHRCGRRPAASAELFGEEAVQYVRRLYVQTESLPLALERLSDTGLCTPQARELIDRYRERGDYPPSFYRLFRVRAEEWAKARGPKAFDGVTHTARRGMWYLDKEGRRVEIHAGDLVEADDVSVDVPYCMRLPDGSWRVGRQVLCFRDRRTRKWLGAYAVARERDSYRGEDIARATRELVAAWGLPGRLRFERGSWESEPVRGIRVADGRGGERRWGGICEVVPVDHVFTSRGKGTIESGFRMMHKALGLEGVRIGKSRGEYEQPTADMLAVNAGRKDPRECGFVPWEELLGVFERTFTLLNGRPVSFPEEGRKHCPDDVWARDMARRPAGRLPECPAALAWHFLPVKREVGAGIAQAGHVKVTLTRYPLPFFFRIGGEMEDGMTAPFIERGHRLMVCFDPHRAAEGAMIVNAERGPRNKERWGYLQPLFHAPLAQEAPQYNLAGTARASADIRARRVRDQQVRTAFTSIGLYGAGARRVRQDHDGAAATTRMESGGRSQLREPERPRRGATPKRGLEAPRIVEDFCESGPPPRGAAPAPAHEEDLDLR